MEKNYRTLIALFIAISVISVAGFYKSYFQFFPTFENTPFFTHVHFAIFLSWFAILIWQPMLIKQQNFSLHRKVGRFSYFLAPLMVISIVVMVKMNIADNLSNSKQQAVIAFTGAFLDITSFSIFYIISIVNRHKIRRHVAALIGASLIILNPGMGRLVSDLFSQELGILAMSLTPFLVSFFILFYEKIKLKRPMLKSPYILILFIWTLELALFIILPGTIFWQKMVERIAAL